MATRSASLDVLKLVLALLVVALHIFPVSKMTGLSGLISYEMASGITRIAVPTFFIVSGYLLRNKLEDKNYLKKYCKRILLLYVVWQLIYLPDLLYHYHINWFSTKALIYKLIYGYWHLWYLLASIVGVVLLYFTRNWKVATKLALVFGLFVIGYLLQLTYKLNVFKEFSFFANIYEGIGTSRNAVFFCVSFFIVRFVIRILEIFIEALAMDFGFVFYSTVAGIVPVLFAEIGRHGFFRFTFTH